MDYKDETFSVQLLGDATSAAKWIPYAKKRATNLYETWIKSGGIGHDLQIMPDGSTVDIQSNDFLGARKVIKIKAVVSIFDGIHFGAVPTNVSLKIGAGGAYSYFPFLKTSQKAKILTTADGSAINQGNFDWNDPTAGYLSTDTPVGQLAKFGGINVDNYDITRFANPMCATGILRKLLLLKSGESRKWNGALHVDGMVQKGITVGYINSEFDMGVMRDDSGVDWYVAIGRRFGSGIWMRKVSYKTGKIYTSGTSKYGLISDTILPIVDGGDDPWDYIPFSPSSYFGRSILDPDESAIIPRPFSAFQTPYNVSDPDVMDYMSENLPSVSSCWRFSDTGRKATCMFAIIPNSGTTYFECYDISISGNGIADVDPFIANITKVSQNEYFWFNSSLTSASGNTMDSSHVFSASTKSNGWYVGETKINEPMAQKIKNTGTHDPFVTFGYICGLIKDALSSQNPSLDTELGLAFGSFVTSVENQLKNVDEYSISDPEFFTNNVSSFTNITDHGFQYKVLFSPVRDAFCSDHVKLSCLVTLSRYSSITSLTDVVYICEFVITFFKNNVSIHFSRFRDVSYTATDTSSPTASLTTAFRTSWYDGMTMRFAQTINIRSYTSLPVYSTPIGIHKVRFSACESFTGKIKVWSKTDYSDYETNTGDHKFIEVLAHDEIYGSADVSMPKSVDSLTFIGSNVIINDTTESFSDFNFQNPLLISGYV